MADIKLVIKIPEDIYKDIIETRFIYDEDNEIVADVIKNGTLLDDVLNKIKAEILLIDKNVKDVRTDGHCFFTADEIFEIIDKHRNEVSE